MCTLEVKRSCICITHPSLLDRLAWGPVMQKQVSTSFRAVSVISPAAVIFVWSHLIRCMLATLHPVIELLEAVVMTRCMAVAKWHVHRITHLSSSDGLIFGPVISRPKLNLISKQLRRVHVAVDAIPNPSP